MRTPERILRQDPPTDGMEKAIEAFRFSPGRERAARRAWPALAGLATALSIGGLALRLSAPTAEASPLARIAQAERDAPRCTATSFDPTGRLTSRAWQQGTKVRLDFDPDAPYGFTNAFDGARTWFVRRDAGVAIIVNGTVRQAAPKILQRVTSFDGNRIRSRTDADGTLHVVIEKKVSYDWADAERRTIVADRQGRPCSIEYAVHRKGRWEVASREIRDYDAPIPDGTFVFKVPTGFEAYDIDANRDLLRRGLQDGPVKSVGGMTVRLLGALQERSGRVTAVYAGGVAPLPDAVAFAVRDGRTFPGAATVASPDVPRPQMAKFALARESYPIRQTPLSRARLVWTVSDAPFGTLDGVPIRIVSFALPKLAGNPSRGLRITLPVVVHGPLRTVRSMSSKELLLRGHGSSRGVVTFENVTPIRSNQAEEIERLSTAIAGGLRLDLARKRG